jgi:hypothetical protein
MNNIMVIDRADRQKGAVQQMNAAWYRGTLGKTGKKLKNSQVALLYY